MAGFGVNPATGAEQICVGAVLARVSRSVVVRVFGVRLAPVLIAGERELEDVVPDLAWDLGKQRRLVLR